MSQPLVITGSPEARTTTQRKEVIPERKLPSTGKGTHAGLHTPHPLQEGKLKIPGWGAAGCSFCPEDGC